MKKIIRFIFAEEITQKKLEKQISLAIITAECVFGQAKVRLYAAYLIEKNKVAIDVSSEVGEHVAEAFTSLAIRNFGETSFKVEKIEKEKQT